MLYKCLSEGPQRFLIIRLAKLPQSLLLNCGFIKQSQWSSEQQDGNKLERSCSKLLKKKKKNVSDLEGWATDNRNCCCSCGCRNRIKLDVFFFNKTIIVFSLSSPPQNDAARLAARHCRQVANLPPRSRTHSHFSFSTKSQDGSAWRGGGVEKTNSLKVMSEKRWIPLQVQKRSKTPLSPPVPLLPPTSSNHPQPPRLHPLEAAFLPLSATRLQGRLQTVLIWM